MDSSRKKVCVCIPCYNEEDNVIPLCEELIDLFKNKLGEYDYTIQFIDNCSTDSTQSRLRELCSKYSYVRAILNARNFKGNSALYGMLQSDGDCAVYLSADFQDPIDKIPELLEKWKEGHLIVAAVKNKSKERKLKYLFRKLYYKIMKKGSDGNFIEQFCNFGVYDRKFLDIVRNLKNPNYSIRGNVSEYGYDICFVEYEQQNRRSGKSSYNFGKLLNLGITNFVDYTDNLLRFSITVGGIFSVIFLVMFIAITIAKIIRWSDYSLGVVWILSAVLWIGNLCIFLIGLVGEYVVSTRKKVTDAPLVIEKERINF